MELKLCTRWDRAKATKLTSVQLTSGFYSDLCRCRVSTPSLAGSDIVVADNIDKTGARRGES